MGRESRNKGWDPGARPTIEQAEVLDYIEDGIIFDPDPWIVECLQRHGWIATIKNWQNVDNHHLTGAGTSALRRFHGNG